MTYPNPEQRQVLDYLHGTLLVLAPAGTGKTRLMADRLATGMPPEVTLGVTFTNRADEHMRGAVLESCGPAAKLCRIQTFHSLCAWILRLENPATSDCPRFPRSPLPHLGHARRAPGKARQVVRPLPVDPDGQGPGHPCFRIRK